MIELRRVRRFVRFVLIQFGTVYGTICKQFLRFSRIFVNLVFVKVTARECCKTLTMLTKSNLFIGNIHRIRTLEQRALAFIGQNEPTKRLRIFSFVSFLAMPFWLVCSPQPFLADLFHHFSRKSLSMPNANHFAPRPSVSDTRSSVWAA